ncbi:MAG: hypothetical protein LUG18_12975 [Candidatus Azobacteroides sp.]|nr:hypothetical protein [Candidatus Azobacteroides sp.]
METEHTSLENKRYKENPFNVPNGYFDNLTNQIMASLPEKEEAKKSGVTHHLWKKISPWVYMAAMITGIAFGIKLYVANDVTDPNTTATIAAQQEVTGTFSISEEEVLLSFVSDYDLYEYLYEKE